MLASLFLILLALIVCGIVLSLPILLPPVRRWGRRSVANSTWLVCITGLVSWVLVFGLWARCWAMINYAVSTTPIYKGQDHVYVPPRLEEKKAYRKALVNEFWLRSLVPPPVRRSCYTSDQIVCELAGDSVVPPEWYLIQIGAGVVSAMMSCALTWQFTRPRQTEAK